MIRKLLALLIVCTSVSSIAQTQLSLVGHKVETLISEPGHSARLMDLVDEAFTDTNIDIIATTQAWSGSGLLSGRFSGYIDHYSLNVTKSSYIYSDVYVSMNLHIASRSPLAQSINRFDQVQDERIGIEKRFANTDRLRGERLVTWARRDSFNENVQQLQEGRIKFILADKIMLEEMNKLLTSIGKPPLFISSQPVITIGISLALHPRVSNAEDIIAEFEQGISQLRTTGRFDEIYQPEPSAKSLLDEALYSEILRKW